MEKNFVQNKSIFLTTRDDKFSGLHQSV